MKHSLKSICTKSNEKWLSVIGNLNRCNHFLNHCNHFQMKTKLLFSLMHFALLQMHKHLTTSGLKAQEELIMILAIVAPLMQAEMFWLQVIFIVLPSPSEQLL